MAQNVPTRRETTIDLLQNNIPTNFAKGLTKTRQRREAGGLTQEFPGGREYLRPSEALPRLPLAQQRPA